MVIEMKARKTSLLFASLLAGLALFSCSKAEDASSSANEEASYAYCREYYSAAYGNYGGFAIGALEEAELETSFPDLSKFTLGGAFSSMKIDSAVFSEEDYLISFSLSGSLSSGRSGSIEGEGIVKGRSVKVDVPISEASLSSESLVYEGLSEQEIELELSNSCFNKDLKPSDFTLSGAAKGMSVKSVSTPSSVDEEGNEELSQNATLILSGESDGSDYAYLTVSSSALTYNADLSLALKTDVRGAYILNECIDTFSLSDTLTIQANNISFNEGIKASDVSFGGALKDYASVKKVERVSQTLLSLELSFPYTYLNPDNVLSLGYVNLDASATSANKEVVCSAVVGVPEIDVSLSVNGKAVSLSLTLEHGEWNLLDFYPFTVCHPDGSEILASGVDAIDVDEALELNFTLPDDCSGLLYLTLENAYDVVTSEGKTSVTVKACFNV